MAVFEPLFKALNDVGVRYVVVGGLAVVLHGYARLTVDVEQARKAIKALVGMGLRPRVPVDARDFADRSVREGWIRDRGMQVFSMFDPANPMRVVDLFVHHPIPFEELWARSSEFELQDTIVHVASIPDIGQLEAILEAKKKK